MSPDQVMNWAKAAAIAGGVLVGIFAVYSPSYVWYRKQIFGMAGTVLCGFGTILIVASIFHNLTFAANEKGLEFKLSQIQTEVSQTAAALQSANDKLAKIQEVASAPQVTKAQIAGLRHQLDEGQKNLQAQLSQLQGHISHTEAAINTRNNELVQIKKLASANLASSTRPSDLENQIKTITETLSQVQSTSNAALSTVHKLNTKIDEINAAKRQ